MHGEHRVYVCMCVCGERLQCPACWAPLTSCSVPGQEEMVFYYYSNSSVPVGRFQGRVRWQGDVSCWDGSIQLQDVQVNDSGRYTCEIRLFQHGSIFKNHTILHVSPEIQRGVSPSLSPHLTLTKGFPYLPAQFCSSAGVPVVGSSPALVSLYR